jgi:hypothetical protein
LLMPNETQKHGIGLRVRQVIGYQVHHAIVISSDDHAFFTEQHRIHPNSFIFAN